MIELDAFKEVSNKESGINKLTEHVDTKSINVLEMDRPLYEFNKSMQSSEIQNEVKKMDIDKENITDEKNRIILITRNESLEGDVHPITGIPFERKEIAMVDEIIEGVFPKFNSVFETKISSDLHESTDFKQFKFCNEQLYDAIKVDESMRAQFTKDQIEQIKEGVSDGTAPDGFVWHHDAELGKIQLVDFESHANTGHTGGRCVWGGGNDNR